MLLLYLLLYVLLFLLFFDVFVFVIVVEGSIVVVVIAETSGLSNMGRMGGGVVFVLWLLLLMRMMMLLFLFLFYPRNLPLKFGQNQVSNRWNVAVVFVVLIVVVDPPFKAWLNLGQEQLRQDWVALKSTPIALLLLLCHRCL